MEVERWQEAAVPEAAVPEAAVDSDPAVPEAREVFRLLPAEAEGVVSVPEAEAVLVPEAEVVSVVVLAPECPDLPWAVDSVREPPDVRFMYQIPDAVCPQTEDV